MTTFFRGAALASASLLTAGCGAATSPDSNAASSAFFFPSSGASLHYHLDFPVGRGPFPAVLVGHGAGATPLEEGALHVPFLTGAGFAVLRYDKRGVGLSTGTYRGLTALNSESQVGELAGDMSAGVAFLKTRPEIDARRIGLLGVSQAGWIMAEAARQSLDVRFMIAISGSTLPVGANIYYENLPATASLDANYASLAAYNGARGWDPKPALAELRIPAIWLFGAEDRLVPTRECARILDELQVQGHRYRFFIYPGFGHELSGSGAVYWADILPWMAAEGIR